MRLRKFVRRLSEAPMENKPRKVIIEHLGKERKVEIEHGPFKLFTNNLQEYYEGWVMPEPLDPYGEPYKVIFTKDSIKREA